MSASASFVPREAPSASAIILVCQDNVAESITIDLVSGAVTGHLGYDEASLRETSFFDILEAESRETIEDMLEYEADSRDLSEVLRRIRSVNFRHKNGDTIPLAVKAVREVTPDDKHWFRLILTDEKRQDAEQQILSGIQDRFAAHTQLHAFTELPNRYSAEQYLNEVIKLHSAQGLQCCFALVQIDRHTKNEKLYGEEACLNLLRHVANVCERNFRNGDVITEINSYTLGVFLFNIDREAAALALSRLRWAVTSHRIPFGGKQDFSVTVSVSLEMVSEHTDKRLIFALENELAALADDRRNAFVDANITLIRV